MNGIKYLVSDGLIFLRNGQFVHPAVIYEHLLDSNFPLYSHIDYVDVLKKEDAVQLMNRFEGAVISKIEMENPILSVLTGIGAVFEIKSDTFLGFLFEKSDAHREDTLVRCIVSNNGDSIKENFKEFFFAKHKEWKNSYRENDYINL